MCAEYNEPTKAEMEYMHGYANLLMAEEWFVEQILSGDDDAWNKHVARVEAIINGQQEQKEYE